MNETEVQFLIEDIKYPKLEKNIKEQVNILGANAFICFI